MRAPNIHACLDSLQADNLRIRWCPAGPRSLERVVGARNQANAVRSPAGASSAAAHGLDEFPLPARSTHSVIPQPLRRGGASALMKSCSSLTLVGSAVRRSSGCMREPRQYACMLHGR
jgi:hypothetical protein